MGNFLLAALLSITSAPASANDLGVSIHIGQRGFYGQINLGNHYPQPQLIYPNPVLAMSPAIAAQQQPIYLRVPPGHAKKWSKHCHRYNACNQPVYFIQENWYNDVYVPHYHSQNNSGGHYDSERRYDDDDDSRKRSQGHNESHRDSHANNQRKHDDRDNPGRGDGKHEKGNHDKKEQNRGNNQRD